LGQLLSYTGIAARTRSGGIAEPGKKAEYSFTFLAISPSSLKLDRGSPEGREEKAGRDK
jgi:hypothetical protein